MRDSRRSPVSRCTAPRNFCTPSNLRRLPCAADRRGSAAAPRASGATPARRFPSRRAGSTSLNPAFTINSSLSPCGTNTNSPIELRCASSSLVTGPGDHHRVGEHGAAARLAEPGTSRCSESLPVREMIHRIDAQQRIERVVFEWQRPRRIRHHGISNVRASMRGLPPRVARSRRRWHSHRRPVTRQPVLAREVQRRAAGTTGHFQHM